MIRYILRRVVTMALMLLLISAIVFIIIKLPPGDILTNQIEELRAQGEQVSDAKAQMLMQQYGLDQPGWKQYAIWMGLWPGTDGFNGVLEGNWGWSFEYQRPVSEVLGGALLMTVIVNLATIVFIHLVSIPVAIYTARNRYTATSHAVTFLSYLGIATPNFLLALALLFYFNRWFGISVGGMMDPKYTDAGWSLGKLGSVASHLVVPVVVIGLASTAGMIRRMRANLLDELNKQYTLTAKAKGMPPTRALLKYPFRMALNPFVADIGNLLPSIVSGSVLVSLVLSLPTVGPILLQALKVQDQYLAGFILLFVAALTVAGMLVSDLMLAAIDPRIRLGQGR